MHVANKMLPTCPADLYDRRVGVRANISGLAINGKPEQVPAAAFASPRELERF